MRFSVWKYIDERKKSRNKISIDPNVPISKPLPKSEIYLDEEKSDAHKKTIGINAPNKIILSFGIENFPSPKRAMSQKNTARVIPTDTKNPLLASSVTGINGMKKNNERKIVPRRVVNDNLLKNSTVFDSIFLNCANNNVLIIPNNDQ